METYAGILTVIVVIAVIWYGVRARNRYHDTHEKPQQGSGGAGSKDRDPDKH